MLKNIEAVIFDLDGSLVDSMWLWHDIDTAYLGRFGITVPEDLSSIIEGMGFSETAQYFKKRFQLSDSIEKIKEDWNKMAWDKYAHEVPLKKGAHAFLNKCRQKGIRLGIASSNSRELIENVVTVNGVLHFFDCIVTSCDVAHGKPAPDVYLEAARQCKTVPEKCLVFEDIIPGIQAGKAAGMKVCAVADEYSRSQEPEKRKLSDYFIEDYCELI